MAVDSTSALFVDPVMTATGEPRALVKMTGLETLWFNTGTLCNIACDNCYIESSPENDRLEYLSLDDVAGYLDEIEAKGLDNGSLRCDPWRSIVGGFSKSRLLQGLIN